MNKRSARAARYAAVLVAAVAGTAWFPARRSAMGAAIIWIDPADPTGQLNDANAATNLNGIYTNTAHWNPGGLPGLTADLVFNAPGYPNVPYTVTFNADASANSISVSNPVTLNLNQFHLTLNQATMSAASASLVIANTHSLTVENGFVLAQSLDVGSVTTAVPLANTFLAVNGTLGNAQLLVHSGSTVNVYQTISLTNGATFNTGDNSLVNMAPDIASGGYNTGSIVVDNSSFFMGDGATLRGGAVIVQNGGQVMTFGSSLTFDSLFYNSDLNLSGAFTMNLQSSLLDPHNSNHVIPTTITGGVDVDINQFTIKNAIVILSPDSGSSFTPFTVVGNTGVTILNSALTTGLLNLDGDGAPGTGSNTAITTSALTVHDDMWIGELGNASVNASGSAINIDGALIVGDQENSSGTLVLDGPTSIINTGLNPSNDTFGYGLGHLIVGSFGTGQVTISGGARINVGAGWEADVGLGDNGDGTGGTGTLTVTGAWNDASGNVFASTLNVDGGNGRLFAGVLNHTLGVVNITGGGSVSDSDGEVGTSAGAVGIVNVDGGYNNTVSNSLFLSAWANSGSVYIGDAGTGTLTISNLAGVTAGNDFVIGNNTGSTGDVLVTTFANIGVDLNQDDAHALFVGASGSGSLDILAGGGVNAFTSAYIGANSTGTGEVTVDGAESAFSIAETLEVGDLGKGTLTLTNGAAVAGNAVIIADGANSVGSVLVDLSTLSVTSFLALGESGTATMSVRDLGAVDSGDVDIAFNPLSAGSLTIDDARWTATGMMSVGVSGKGVLTIQDGGTVSNADAILGYAAGSSGNVTVDGPGTFWGTSGVLTVGDSGNGTVTISHLAGVTNATTTYLGYGTGSFGEVIVTGAGSRWGEGGDLNIGLNGGGLLLINQGGSVNSNDTTYVAFAAQTKGGIFVQDPGSNWTSNGNVFIGEGGSGTLSITSDASAKSLGAIFVGQNAGSLGQVIIQGTGSTLMSASQIAVGVQGSGTMTISGGAQLFASAPVSSVSHTALAIGDETTGVGVLTVTDPGSKIILTGHLAIGFGNNGSNTSSGGFGTLSILNGAGVSDTNGYIGRYAGSKGVVTVSGNGASWTNSGSLYIAANDTANNASSQVLAAGAGTLIISPGGTVAAAGTIIGPGGVLALQGGTFSTSSATVTGVINGYGQIFGTLQGNASLTVPSLQTLTLDGVQLQGLTVSGKATLRAGDGPAGTMLVSAPPTITGTLDITDDKLILQSTGATGNKASLISALRTLVSQGSNGGSWTGAGITSSVVAQDVTTATTHTYHTTVAIADVGSMATPFTTYGGQAVNTSSILVTRALIGDGDLNNTINNADLVVLFNHFGNTGATQTSGDYDGNGTVNNADLVSLFNDFGQSLPGGFSVIPDVPGPNSVGASSNPSAPAPEPASLAVLALGGGVLLRRRRWKK